MKNKADLVRGWLAKAESDLTCAQVCLEKAQALDVVCFHAQQAAEKHIKAYLLAREIDFPFVHDLERLLDLCIQCDPSFSELLGLALQLTPYAVGTRYEPTFWPDEATAREAVEDALAIKDFVLARLPDEFK